MICLLSIFLFQRIQNFINLFGRQIFVVIETDLHHRRGSAASETFNQWNRKFAVGRRFARVNSQTIADMFGNFRLAHNFARERFADLQMMSANLSQVEHRIKRRRFPNVRHFQIEKIEQKLAA